MNSDFRSIHKQIITGIAAALLLVFLMTVEPAGAAAIQPGDCTVSVTGGFVECPIVLDQAPAGLSGFEVTVGLEDREIAEVTGVKFPSWATLNSRSKVPADAVTLKGSDPGNKVRPGDHDVVLAVLTIRGDAPGSSGITVTINRIEDESGAPYAVEGRSGRVTVTGIQVQDIFTGPGNPMATPTPAPVQSSGTGTPPPAGEPGYYGPGETGQGPASPAVPVEVTRVPATPIPGETGEGTGSPAVPVEVTRVPATPTPGETGEGAGSPAVPVEVTRVPATPTPGETGEGAGSPAVPVEVTRVPATPTPGETGEGAGSPAVPVEVTRVPATPTPGETGEGTGSPAVPVEVTRVPTTPTPGETGEGTGSPAVPVEVTRVPATPTPGETGEGTGSPAVPVEVTVVPATPTPEPLGMVSLDSDPRGALVLVDGSPAGTTPLQVSLSPGTHTLEVRGEGECRYEGEITVLAGQTLYLPVIVLSAPACATITAGAGPHGSVQPSGEVKVAEGGTASFTFRADPGYRLDNVSLDGDWIGPQPTINFVQVYGTHRVEGVFASIPPPAANFTANETEGRAPLAVNFTDRSTGSVDSLLWDFGDNTTATAPQPTHIYAVPGNFTVSLKACGAGGCDTCTKAAMIAVLPPEPLKANFTANATSGVAPLAVHFSDTSSGNPRSWRWDFGDGAISADADPVHVYSWPGVYDVSLTVIGGGAIDRAGKPGFIEVGPPVIGGGIGYIRVHCNVEFSRVYLDNEYKGIIQKGNLSIPVYVTGTPYRTVSVRADGYLPFSAPITHYPVENGTVDIVANLTPYLTITPGSGGAGGVGSLANLTSARPLQWPDADRPA